MSTRASRTVGLVGVSGGRALKAPMPRCRALALDGRRHRGPAWSQPTGRDTARRESLGWGLGRGAVALRGDCGSRAVKPGKRRGEETARGDTGGGGLAGDAQTPSGDYDLQETENKAGIVRTVLGLQYAKYFWAKSAGRPRPTWTTCWVRHWRGTSCLVGAR